MLPRNDFLILTIALVASTPLWATANQAPSSASPRHNVGAAVWRQTRRWLNFSSLLGSPTAVSPYQRIAGHPVFAVTTPWGSPYMNMERLDDLDEIVKTNAELNRKKGSSSISEEQNEYRTVVLYFMDPDDATAVHGEMKQMENMQSADLRITTFSLSKALRQAANLGQGLPTGVAPDPLNGNLPISQGAALRYKIVPPKRQLFYAARCYGKERVGLWGESAAQDAQTALLGNGALEAENLMRRRQKRERKTMPSRTVLQQQNAHMEGYTGIPVFYHPSLQRKPPLLKRILSGNRHEIPLFFNYEDLEDAYQTLRSRSRTPIPAKMQDVEVFNLWDILTSMDRVYSTQNKWEKALRRLGVGSSSAAASKSGPGLNDITFVANSRAARYKENISSRGNGKARLRPMR